MDESALAAAAASLEGALGERSLERVPNEALQRLVAAAIRTYAAKNEAGDRFPPFDPEKGRVSPTDIMVTTSALLRAGNLQAFELGMWQSWTGS